MRHDHERTEFEATIDLNELAQRHDLRIVVEPKRAPSIVETDNLIKQEDAAHSRRKDWLLFRVGVAASTIVGALCIWLVVTSSEAPQRNWALATLTAMATSLLGYISGRKQSST